MSDMSANPSPGLMHVHLHDLTHARLFLSASMMPLFRLLVPGMLHSPRHCETSGRHGKQEGGESPGVTPPVPPIPRSATVLRQIRTGARAEPG
jgi:hypothetical protein